MRLLLSLLPWRRDRETIRRRLRSLTRTNSHSSAASMQRVATSALRVGSSGLSCRASPPDSRREGLSTGRRGTTITDPLPNSILKAGSELRVSWAELSGMKYPTTWEWPLRPGFVSSAPRTSQGQADGRSAAGAEWLGYVEGLRRREG